MKKSPRNTSPDLMPLNWFHIEAKAIEQQASDKWPRGSGSGGRIRITVEESSFEGGRDGGVREAEVFEIELFRRPGYPAGLIVRGVPSTLNIEPIASNTILIKPSKGRP